MAGSVLSGRPRYSYGAADNLPDGRPTDAVGSVVCTTWRRHWYSTVAPIYPGDAPMKAVIPCVSDPILAWRKHSGADQYDEMWEGVLHMPPVPNRFHQDLEFALEAWLRWFWAPLH